MARQQVDAGCVCACANADARQILPVETASEKPKVSVKKKNTLTSLLITLSI
jgi:hypothetical protein